jgi:hypothetical protein
MDPVLEAVNQELQALTSQVEMIRQRVAVLQDIKEKLTGRTSPDPLMVPTWTIRSHTRWGLVHTVQLINNEYHCTCEGFTYRGTCRHVLDCEADAEKQRIRQEFQYAKVLRN